MSKKVAEPWPLTEFNLCDVCEVDGQFDEHRIMLGFRLYDGATMFLTVIHGVHGFKVHVDQDRGEWQANLKAVDASTSPAPAVAGLVTSARTQKRV